MIIDRVKPIIPYVQYLKSKDIVSVAQASNAVIQEYLTDYAIYLAQRATDFRAWTGDELSDAGYTLYGIKRPYASIADFAYDNPITLWDFGALYDAGGADQPTSDFIYKKLIFFEARRDFKTINILNLKRRISDFCDIPLNEVSVTQGDGIFVVKVALEETGLSLSLASLNNYKKLTLPTGYVMEFELTF